MSYGYKQGKHGEHLAVQKMHVRGKVLAKFMFSPPNLIWWSVKWTHTSEVWWTAPVYSSTPVRSVKDILSNQCLRTWNSSLSSGTMRKVLQPLSFLDLSTSPKMWSPTYSTSLKRQKWTTPKKDALICKTKVPHLPLAPISLERTSELPPLYTAESSKVPLWDPMLRRPVSLFT